MMDFVSSYATEILLVFIGGFVTFFVSLEVMEARRLKKLAKLMAEHDARIRAVRKNYGENQW